MNTSTILQVPIDKSFRDEISVIAKNMGFSSLQDLVRFTLHQIKSQTLVPSLINPSYQLSHKALSRYNKLTKDVVAGKNVTKSFAKVDDMIDYLNK